MNCKPGDLAVVVRVGPLTRDALGRVVRVEQIGEPSEFGQSWTYSPKIWCGGYEVIWLEDCCLRPILDPGEDALDETLHWIPVPGKVAA